MTYNITTAPKPPIFTPRRVMGLIALIIITPFLLAFIGGSMMGIAKGMQENPIHTSPTNSSQVKDFNDGFAASKADDCQQGDQAACDWMNSGATATPTPSAPATTNAIAASSKTKSTRPKTCHSAYTISAHWVGGHTSAKGKYTAPHEIPAHTVKANCPAI